MRFILPITLFCCLASTASAQAFEAGWYIVNPSAEFVVVQRAPNEPNGQLWIAAGEAVLCYDKTSSTYLCFEQHGRMSAIRGHEPLSPVAAAGKPGHVVQDIQLMDRRLPSGMVVWVVDLDAGAGVATVQLDGRTEEVPASSVAMLPGLYRQALTGQTFQPVMN